MTTTHICKVIQFIHTLSFFCDTFRGVTAGRRLAIQKNRDPLELFCKETGIYPEYISSLLPN